MYSTWLLPKELNAVFPEIFQKIFDDLKKHYSVEKIEEWLEIRMIYDEKLKSVEFIPTMSAVEFEGITLHLKDDDKSMVHNIFSLLASRYKGHYEIPTRVFEEYFKEAYETLNEKFKFLVSDNVKETDEEKCTTLDTLSPLLTEEGYKEWIDKGYVYIHIYDDMIAFTPELVEKGSPEVNTPWVVESVSKVLKKLYILDNYEIN